MAIVQPLLQKPTLDPDAGTNFQPISLAIPFKGFRKIQNVVEQIIYFMNGNGNVQSVFRAGFSTALVRVLNDRFFAADCNQHTVLLLLVKLLVLNYMRNSFVFGLVLHRFC